MKTVLSLKIELPADEWDKLERRGREISKWSLKLLEDVIDDILMGELGIIGKTTVTKIE